MKLIVYNESFYRTCEKMNPAPISKPKKNFFPRKKSAIKQVMINTAIL